MNIGDKVFVYRDRPKAESHLTTGPAQPEVGFITFVKGLVAHIAGFAADGSIFSLLNAPLFSGSGPAPKESHFTTEALPPPKPVVTTSQASPRATEGPRATVSAASQAFQAPQASQASIFQGKNKAGVSPPVVTH